MPRRRIILLVILLLPAAVLVGGYLLFVRGVFGADHWAARQVVRIVNTYLVPDIHFDDFDFTPPGTITFRNVTLIAPDRTEVASAAAMRVTLDSVPAFGKPIVIRAIELDDAALRLIREPESRGGGFRGLVPFARTENIRDQSRVDDDLRLSNVLHIRDITLRNASIIYEEPGQPPMIIAGLTLDLDVEPTDEHGRVWHAFETDAAAGDLAHLHAAGRINLDDLIAQISAITLDIELDESTYSILPPQLQSTMRDNDARGSLKLRVSGELTLRDVFGSTLEANAALTDLNLAAGEYRLHVDSGDVAAQLASGVATLDRADFKLLDGEFSISEAEAWLKETGAPAQLSWSARGLRLENLLRTRTEGEPPSLAGVFRSGGSVETSLADPLGALSGEGTIRVREGRLINLPIISALARTLDVVGRVRGDAQRNDTADLDFTLGPDGVNITRGEAVTNVLAARMTGTIRYDGALRLDVNAGPLERVQRALGPIGDIFGAITDRLVTYRVTGRIGAPEVSVRPLGM